MTAISLDQNLSLAQFAAMLTEAVDKQNEEKENEQ